MGRWKHGVEQLLAVAGMQNQQKEKHLPGKYELKGRYVQRKTKTRKKGHTFNRFIRRVRERVTEN